MKLRILFVAGVASVIAASGAMSQELRLNQVGAGCGPLFRASAATNGNVPITVQNWRNTDVIVAWMNFAGNAQLIKRLAPLETFNDVSKPQHVYLFMDDALNCIGSVTMGFVEHTGLIDDTGLH